MDSEEFHRRVIATFKTALTKWDWDNNPLEWEGLPQDVLSLMAEATRAMLSGETMGGYPLMVGNDYGNDPDGKGEAVIRFSMAYFELESASDEISLRKPLSAALIEDCEDGDQGWLLARHLNAIERSIALAREEAEKRGWVIDATI